MDWIGRNKTLLIYRCYDCLNKNLGKSIDNPLN